eukprot:TRINITY_DN3158_c0_g1_i1.p1 TRINITY_DN3158_c0_g1~~TRINITY_DN3158_c0_g1_i1.p1  ORF type:complete len:167 (+),score=21.83 TRINITY_DN3158_c0_g1_i1:484-984(+)
MLTHLKLLQIGCCGIRKFFRDALKINSTVRKLEISVSKEEGCDDLCEGVLQNVGLTEIDVHVGLSYVSDPIDPKIMQKITAKIQKNKKRFKALRCVFMALWGTCGSLGRFDRLPIELMGHIITYICEWSFPLPTVQALLSISRTKQILNISSENEFHSYLQQQQHK